MFRAVLVPELRGQKWGEFMIKCIWKMLLTASHYWTFPVGVSKLIARGGPEVKKSVKKCRLTQNPATVFDHRIFFSSI